MPLAFIYAKHFIWTHRDYLDHQTTELLPLNAQNYGIYTERRFKAKKIHLMARLETRFYLFYLCVASV